MDAAFEVLHEGGHEVAVVLEALRRGCLNAAGAARPLRRTFQASDDLQPGRAGSVHQPVVLVPGALAVLVVKEVALGRDLDLVPGEHLAYEAKSRLVHRIDAALELGTGNDLVQLDIHAIAVIRKIAYDGE